MHPWSHWEPEAPSDLRYLTTEQKRWQVLHLDLRAHTHFGWSDMSNLLYDAKFYC